MPTCLQAPVAQSLHAAVLSHPPTITLRSYCAGNYKPEWPPLEELEPGSYYLAEVRAKHGD